MEWWYDPSRQMLHDQFDWHHGFSQTWWLTDPHWLQIFDKECE